MIELITAPENLPFAVALVVLLIIALLEGLGALLGAGLSTIFGSLFPELGLDASGPDLESQGAFGRALSWLRFGEVPFLVLLIVFLTGFGVGGVLMQKSMLAAFGFMLPAGVAWIPALVVSLFVVRVLGGLLNNVLPKDETSAVSKETFIGRAATITLGTASKGNPAQGKVKDQFGQYHYIMIEPEEEGVSFAQGDETLLVRLDGSKFYAVKMEY